MDKAVCCGKSVFVLLTATYICVVLSIQGKISCSICVCGFNRRTVRLVMGTVMGTLIRYAENKSEMRTQLCLQLCVT